MGPRAEGLGVLLATDTPVTRTVLPGVAHQRRYGLRLRRGGHGQQANENHEQPGRRKAGRSNRTRQRRPEAGGGNGRCRSGEGAPVRTRKSWAAGLAMGTAPLSLFLVFAVSCGWIF